MVQRAQNVNQVITADEENLVIREIYHQIWLDLRSERDNLNVLSSINKYKRFLGKLEI
jgi:hypothetical protein